MKHTPVELLRDIADVHDADQPPLSRHARLKRWAEVLEREPRRRLKALEEIEAMPRTERHGHRVDDSPLAVAFSDPVLRACGLRGDRFGDALDFFGLTERQAHYLLCSCMNGRYMEAGRTAE